MKGLDGGIQEGEVIKKGTCLIFGRKESPGKVVGTLGITLSIETSSTKTPFAELPRSINGTRLEIKKNLK